MTRAAATCAKCGKRMAKRSCPALGTRICQLCCGKLREKEVHCPPACPHLAAHRPYQEKKIIDRKQAPAAAGTRKDILSDERISWLAFNVAATLRAYAAANPAFTDKDAILALEYAREKVEKGASRLILPGASLKPASEPGEAVLQAVEACRWQPSAGLIVPSSEIYGKDDKTAVLDRMGFEARALSASAPEGRLYLEMIASRLEKAGYENSGARKLVTLT